MVLHHIFCKTSLFGIRKGNSLSLVVFLDKTYAGRYELVGRSLFRYPYRGGGYIKYAVISVEPEGDTIGHVRQWAGELGIQEPEIIGWDFPVCSQEQANVYNMRGYEAALILKNEDISGKVKAEVFTQEKHKYVAITIKEPSRAPFRLIPNAYRILMSCMEVNGMGR